MKNYNLIIADDDRTIRKLLEMKATQYGFKPLTVENGAEVLDNLTDHVDVILLDINMPVMDGFECLEELSKRKQKIPVVMLSAEHEAATAMKAVKLGAMDYLSKPFDLDTLFTTLRNAKNLSVVQKENVELKEAVTEPSLSTGLIASSPATKQVLSKANKIAKLDSTVLLTGESGTGKGVFARYIHANSPRANKPFITVSCPALPRELLESELFGHEKGAFTGALKKRIGKIEAAAGGTLFLDEIGDLPIDLQPKLLNVLQDQEFTRVGGDTVIRSDVRIITATNIDFQQKIIDKEFREDLYYRISVIPLELPPLRKRSSEIKELADYFVSSIAKRRGSPSIEIEKEALKALEAYHWPGNVRELENLIERASAFCEENTITLEDLPNQLLQTTKKVSLSGLAGHTLVELEVEAIKQTLELCLGNKAETARRLGITEKSIYNKMKRHQISG